VPSSFSRIQHITDPGAPHGVAVHGEHIQWAAAGALVARANIDGSVVNRNLITGARFSSGMAVDGAIVEDVGRYRRDRWRARRDSNP